MKQDYLSMKDQLSGGQLTGAKLNNLLDSTWPTLPTSTGIPKNNIDPLVGTTRLVVNPSSSEHGRIYRRAQVTNQAPDSSSDWEFVGSFITGGAGLITAHGDLTGRSDADSHPIGAITNLQTTLDSKVNKTFTGVQDIVFPTQSTFRFTGGGNFIAIDDAGTKSIGLLSDAQQIRFNDNLLDGSASGAYTWIMPAQSGTVALTSQIPDVSGYLPKTFASPQVLEWAGVSRWTFDGAGIFKLEDLTASRELLILPNSSRMTMNGNNLDFPIGGGYQYILPNASGTLALTSQIPSIPVTSVFGRTGAVVAQSGDYSAFYQPLDAELTALSALSGTSGLIRRTGSSYVYDNTVYATLTDLGNYLPLAGGTMAGAINMGAFDINNISQARFNNNANAYVTNQTTPVIYSTSTGGTGVFAEAGNLILSPRISGASRDIIISTLGTKADLTVDRNGNTNLLGNLNIGNTVSYANMPTTTWEIDLGTTSSQSVDDTRPARWTTRVSGTNATGYELRWLSESRSGAGMGDITERMMLNNNALTLTTQNARGIRLKSLVSGSQIQMTSLDNANGWRAGISSDVNGDYIIVNDTGVTIPFKIAKSDNAVTLLGSLTAPTARLASTPSGTVVTGGWLGLDSSGNVVKAVAPGGGNPFNQSLNTTDSVTFNNLNLSGSATIGGATITGALNAGNGIFGGTLSMTASSVKRFELETGTDTFFKSYDSAGVLLDNAMVIRNISGGQITFNRVTNHTTGTIVSQTLNIGTGNAGDLGNIYYLKPTGAGSIIHRYMGSGTTPPNGIQEIVTSDASNNMTQYRLESTNAAFGSPVAYTFDVNGNTFSIGCKLNTSASIAGRAGFNLPTGVAVTSPLTGDMWSPSADTLNWRSGSNTRTVAFREVNNTFAGTQTFNILTSTAVITARSYALTAQTNTPTGTTYTWTLTSGNQLDITLTSSTGDVTVTTAAPTAATYSFLSVTGHGTLARNITITQSGVTFIMAGKTSGNSILLDSIPATKRAMYELIWITTTKCFINRIVLEA